MEAQGGEKVKGGYPSSPATTPGSVFDDKKSLVPFYYKRENKRIRERKWNDLRSVPFAIFSVSILQIILHAFSNGNISNILRFEPSKRFQAWRFVSYMLVHDDLTHLTLNVVIQCIFAYFLEIKQGHWRVLALYILGGFTGVLGASCYHPDFVIGASAGVYALLISKLSDIILNYHQKYILYFGTCVGVLVFFDVIYNVVHVYCNHEPPISWPAHLNGGLAGLFLGLVLYKSYEKDSRNKYIASWLGLGLYLTLLATLVIVTTLILKCTPKDAIHVRYVYFC